MTAINPGAAADGSEALLTVDDGRTVPIATIEGDQKIMLTARQCARGGARCRKNRSGPSRLFLGVRMQALTAPERIHGCMRAPLPRPSTREQAKGIPAWEIIRPARGAEDECSRS